MNIKITKINDDKMQVSGWAYVSTVEGKMVPDHSGEVININTLEKAAHSYIQSDRKIKEQHVGTQIAYIKDSVVFSKEVQETLGIDLKMEGWWIKLQVTDTDVWAKIKNGELKMFSIGGLRGAYKE